MSRKTYFAAVGVLAVVLAALVFAIPADEILGNKLKLVLFHGATTWANIFTFTVTSVLALAFLVLGREGLYRWTRGFRFVSAPFWLINAGLGVVSMYVSWGGFYWSEPRMQMTIRLLFAALAVLAAGLVFENRRVLAGLDIAMGAFLWGSLLLTQKVFHPDSPVMQSGGSIVALFAGLVVASVLASLVTAAIFALREEDASQS